MAQATSHKIARRFGLPFVVLPLSRLPPLCLLPGQPPAHEAMCFSEAQRVIAVQIAARMLAAAVSSIPTTLCTNSMASSKGCRYCSISAWSWAKDSIRQVDVRQNAREQHTMMRLHTSIQGEAQVRQFGP